MEQEYAGILRRVGSAIIDMTILFIVIFGLYYLFCLAVHLFYSPEISSELQKNTFTLHHLITNNLSTLNNMDHGQVSVTYNSLTLDILSVVFAVIAFIIPPVYYTFCWKKRNATIGATCLNLKVLHENGEKDMSVFRLFIRWLLYFLSCVLHSIIIVNFFLVIFANKKQLIHDLLCQTVVVKVQD